MKTSDIVNWISNTDPKYTFIVKLPANWDALVLTCTEKETGYYYSTPISGVTLEHMSEDELKTYTIHLAKSMILALEMRKDLQ